MKAHDLFETVKRLPKDAWPFGVRFSDVFLLRHDGDGEPGKHEFALPDEVAVSLFEASMMKWLIGEGFHSFEFEPGETDASYPSLTLYDLVASGETHVEILADAVLKVVAYTP